MDREKNKVGQLEDGWTKRQTFYLVTNGQLVWKRTRGN